MTETIIFTLPEEARPEFDQTYVTPVNDDGPIHLDKINLRAFMDDGLENPE